MLLESQLNDRVTLLIDAESVGGIDKGALTVSSHPDRIVPRAVEVIRAVAERLGEAGAVDASTPPSEMEVTFAVRVDSNSHVSIARSPDDGQLRVTLRWRAGPG